MPSSRDLDMMNALENPSFQDDSTTGNHEDEGAGSTIEASVSTPPSEAKDQDAPEVLVQRENQAVRVTAIVVVGVLLTAASLTSFLIYRFTRNSETDSFRSNFDAIGSKITEGLIADTMVKFWMARTVASVITLQMENTGTSKINVTMTPENWQNLNQEALYKGGAMSVAWSPLLFNDFERQAFEGAVQKYAAGSSGVKDTIPCYLCGSPTRGFANLDTLYDIPGISSTMTCGSIEQLGLDGTIPPSSCLALSEAIADPCGCTDLAPDQAHTTENVDTESYEIPPYLFTVDQESGQTIVEPYGQSPYSPIRLEAFIRVIQPGLMFDLMSLPAYQRALGNMSATDMPVLSETFRSDHPYFGAYSAQDINDTHLALLYPVTEPQSTTVAGLIYFSLAWENFVQLVFPPGSENVHVVIENSCGRNFTFSVDVVGNHLVRIGEGDLHEKDFDMVRSTSFYDYEQIVQYSAPAIKDQAGLEYCRYRYLVFPSRALEDQFLTSNPLVYSITTAAIFLFTFLIFLLYDRIVRRRQEIVMASANRTNAIVSSLFPETVRDRLYEQAREAAEKTYKTGGKMSGLRENKLQMQSFLTDDKQGSLLASEPIADTFANATVMFLDVAGFSAWSSEREPSQVFKLLETIYSGFDEIAKSMAVFKVETIGDCYVAVCGLPSPRENHAVVMAQFARKCLRRMNKITRDLEVQLGPSTGDLRARIGLHSGPITAGVLRGEKARFQLFGNTVNTASRLESSCLPNHIHCSRETKELIASKGKESWLIPRPEKVRLKGVGELETFWIKTRTSGPGSVRSEAEDTVNDDDDPNNVDDRLVSKNKRDLRLVDWNVQVLHSLLEKVAQHRVALGKSASRRTADISRAEYAIIDENKSRLVIDEMTQILEMPSFDARVVTNANKGKQVAVNAKVRKQLEHFVMTICSMYRDVPFHNFEHASHVIMSISKLMNRIMNPEGIDHQLDGIASEADKKVAIARQIHQVTYGISSDPLMHFAVAFSALIHDVDHTGLTNGELINMGSNVAKAYQNKTVAEQNSLDIAFALLLEDRYTDLRSYIYTDTSELNRFRQLLVNAVIATDIADKGLKELREKRWDAAFHDGDNESHGSDNVNRKATITFEYIIQASDIAHTMQHWQTYQKFNARLFEERYLAWLNGHMNKNPSEGWYGGELWFFDNYIIPSARKLEKCGVFGVSFDESFNYATDNRREWVEKGKEIVAQMLATAQAKYGTEQKQHDQQPEQAI